MKYLTLWLWRRGAEPNANQALCRKRTVWNIFNTQWSKKYSISHFSPASLNRRPCPPMKVTHHLLHYRDFFKCKTVPRVFAAVTLLDPLWLSGVKSAPTSPTVPRLPVSQTKPNKQTNCLSAPRNNDDISGFSETRKFHAAALSLFSGLSETRRLKSSNSSRRLSLGNYVSLSEVWFLAERYKK